MITVRTRREAVWFLRSASVFGAIYLLIQIFFRVHAIDGASIVAAVCVVVIGLIGVELFRRNRQVTRDADALYIRSMWRATRTVSLSAVSTAIVVPRYLGGRGEASRLMLRDAFGKALLRLESFYWQPEGMSQLAASMPAVLEVVPEGLRGKELVQQFPQAATYQERRPLLFATIFIGSLLALLGAFTAFILVFVA